MPTTYRTIYINGTPIGVPNTNEQRTGYYISYNNYDQRIYGSDTTAIVIDKTGAFLILNGDHREALTGKTLEEACAYFHANKKLKNSMSDPDENFVLKLENPA